MPCRKPKEPSPPFQPAMPKLERNQMATAAAKMMVPAFLT